MERCPSSSILPPRESIHEQPDVSEVAAEAPARRRGVPVRLVGGVPEEGPGIVGGLYFGVQVVVRQFLRREVSEVLVDQVRDVSASDLIVPVGPVAHLLDPGGGDVPVVAYLVVVEDHGGRDGGE